MNSSLLLIAVFLFFSTLFSTSFALPAALRGFAGEGCGRCRLRSFKTSAVQNTTRYGAVDDVIFSDNQHVFHKGQCVQIPYKVLQRFMADPTSWCTWDASYGPTKNKDLRAGQALKTQHNIKPNVKLPRGSVHPTPTIRLANVTTQYSEYGWTSELPDAQNKALMASRHNFAVGKLSDSHSCVESFARYGGPLVKSNSEAFEKSGKCALQSTLDGVKCLEYAFFKEGRLDIKSVSKHCHVFAGHGCNQKAQDVRDCFAGTFSLAAVSKSS